MCSSLWIFMGMNYLHQHKPHAIIRRDLTSRLRNNLQRNILAFSLWLAYVDITITYHHILTLVFYALNRTGMFYKMRQVALRLQILDWARLLKKRIPMVHIKWPVEQDHVKFPIISVAYALPFSSCICQSSVMSVNFSDRYMAPEVYRRESYGKSVDVSSFALIVYKVLERAWLPDILCITLDPN